MRKPLIAGNWKMNKDRNEARLFLAEFLPLIEGIDNNTSILICPPFTLLHEVNELLVTCEVKSGAQDIFWEANGAYTGEISGSMLIDTGCTYVIIGHSERRQVLGESDHIINKKMIQALSAGLTPILCCGETLRERQEKRADQIIRGQLQKALQNIEINGGEDLIIAYEPIWAIGTGVNASSSDAQYMSKLIRISLQERYGRKVADAIRVLYGGSVKEDNIKDFMQQEDIDGALVGGASLNALSFANIVRLGRDG